MSRRKNPFPGVTVHVSRHGTRSWRFRKAGLKTVYFTGEYGSVEFRRWYERALTDNRGTEDRSSAVHGSFGWLIEQYRGTPRFLNLAPSSRRTQFRLQERFREKHGHRMVKHLHSHHIETMMASQADTPAAANATLKLIKKLCRYAVKRQLINTDPTISIERLKENPDGYHVWTDAELDQFEAFHNLGSKANLALRLLIFTGGSRADLVKMGWPTINSGRVQYRRQKTNIEVDLPILPPLLEALQHANKDCLLFITHSGGRSYKPETFGNWFKDQCLKAGLPQCTSHGVRKNGATRMAESGVNELQIASYLGHSNTDEARTYVKSARKGKLGDRAMEALNLDNRVIRLANSNYNPLKNKD